MIGRPAIPAEFNKKYALPTFQSIVGDIRCLLTFLKSVRQNVAVMIPDALNVTLNISNELLARAEELSKVEREMSKLEEAYERFRALTKQAETLEADISEAAAVLGPEWFALHTEADYAEKNVKLSLPVGKLREKLPLWKAMVCIVKHTPWIQIVDMEELLSEISIHVSRAAIESALTVHKKVFRIRRIERAKFMALRE
jgi:hypothetical protein